MRKKEKEKHLKEFMEAVHEEYPYRFEGDRFERRQHYRSWPSEWLGFSHPYATQEQRTDILVNLKHLEYVNQNHRDELNELRNEFFTYIRDRDYPCIHRKEKSAYIMGEAPTYCKLKEGLCDSYVLKDPKTCIDCKKRKEPEIPPLKINGNITTSGGDHYTYSDPFSTEEEK